MPKTRKAEKQLYDSDVDIFAGEDDADDQEIEVKEKRNSKKAKVSNRSKR